MTSKKLMRAIPGLRIKAPASRFLLAPDPSSPGPTDVIGMEVELERVGLGSIALRHAAEVELGPYWKVVEDGSLRNSGGEFVSAPVFGADIQQALVVLNSFFLDRGITPDCAPRAGLHIHMDVGDIDLDQFVRLLEVYIIAEPLLYAVVGHDRDTNQFCLPWYKTKSVLWKTAAFCADLPWAEADSVVNHVPDLYKYSGLNLRPLVSNTLLNMGDNDTNKTGGHIEFRMAPAAYKAAYIIPWVHILLCLKAFARDPNNYIPVSAEDASRLDAKRYFDDIFAQHLPPASLAFLHGALKGKDVPKLISNGLRTLSYFKVVRTLNLYNATLVPRDIGVMYKQTHPGLKTLYNKIAAFKKAATTKEVVRQTFNEALDVPPVLPPMPRGIF